MQSLVFFDSSGNNLNFTYNPTTDLFSGNLIFPENGSDTFKTIGLYLFEEIDTFEFQDQDNLFLQKFQLFNEYRFNFTGGTYSNIPILNIEAPNNNPAFFSKWIYGDNFEKMFPIGSQILFDSPIFEFTNPIQSYSVVYSKKGAIMILDSLDNRSFSNLYGSFGTSSFVGKSISILNSFGVYGYLKSSLENNLSVWSEPDFYTQYFDGRKLNIINTANNNGVYTIKNSSILDKIYYKYQVSSNNIPSGANVIAEVVTKTDLPIIYSGPLNILANSIVFTNNVSILLTPGSTITIVDSIYNTNYITISQMPTFSGNTPPTYYATQSQVLYNNLIYQCVQAYTQYATSSILPSTYPEYWTNYITYLNVNETLTTETILYTDIHLDTNVFYFGMTGSTSSNVTLASLAQAYQTDFSLLNMNIYYSNNVLHADLNYASQYNIVNFYQTAVGLTYSIGTIDHVYENTVQITETVTPELNTNICSNFNYNIVFLNLDEYGITIQIDKQVYQQSIQWVYSGLNIDQVRTIDKTLRSWLSSYYVTLYSLGLVASLFSISNGSSIYFDSIILKTQYPNVPVINLEVLVGTTADFHIEHSYVTFYDIGNILTFNINGIAYSTNRLVNSNNVYTTLSIPMTIDNWITQYSSLLSQYGIYVSNLNNTIFFNIKSSTQLLNYTISIGKSFLPGLNPYIITSRLTGSFGSLVTSNSAILTATSSSFEDPGFATGMVTSVNNTTYTYDNQEYNILYVDNQNLIFSYQGPFWGTTNPYCDTSPYTIIAFSLGFGATGCTSVIPPPVTVGGAFSSLSYNIGYDIGRVSPNTYTTSEYDTNPLIVGSASDIIYNQLSQSIYVLGNNLVVFDAIIDQVITTIALDGNSGDKLVNNPINNCLYVLTSGSLIKVDPLLNQVITVFSLTNSVSDCIINEYNGDTYVSYSNIDRIDIFDINDGVSIFVPTWAILSSPVGFSKMCYNNLENHMYACVLDATTIISINGSTKLQNMSYLITNSLYSLYYEPTFGSIYAFGDYLYKINNGVITQLSILTNSSNNIVFNNLTDGLVISIGVTNSGIIYSMSLDGTISSSSVIADYGQLTLNQYDSDIYISSQDNNSISVIDPVSSQLMYNESFSGQVKKTIYNPSRNSIWGIIPSANMVIEIISQIGATIQTTQLYNGIYENQYGTLANTYIQNENLWLKTRSYIRAPRENYDTDNQVTYVWTWLTDDVPSIFLYDFSGEQLPMTGSYAYVGTKPLTDIYLNRNPNNDITKVSLSQYQQTIFREIDQTLEYINSSTDLSFMPTPLEVFIGFNSKDEGVVSSTLLLNKRENIKWALTTTSLNSNIITFNLIIGSSSQYNYGEITLSTNSSDTFLYGATGLSSGLKVGQLVKLTVKDNTNSNNKYISFNNGITIQIESIYNRYMTVSFVDIQMANETTLISNYPVLGSTTYMTTTFTVVDKTIGKFNISGQTEIEDIRYKTELDNAGKNIAYNDTFIFKSYDINEQGVDWTFLNKKRKEMLMVRDQIFPYVGSYKAIINSINYFGYNDLQLYEYYQNVNPTSSYYGTLFKVEIPDIFDNTVPGWTVNDFIANTYPNANYSVTNLFNLTYLITDKSGNNLLSYSLNEVITKLEGLKYWLQSNVIPITHKILDITGRADFVGPNSIVHKSYDCTILNTYQTMTPVDFKLNEAYLMPINSGSTVYNVVIDFYTAPTSSIYGESNYNATIPDYYSLNLRTYQTYLEWYPFATYNVGDTITYFDNYATDNTAKVYVSYIGNNKLNTPTQYDGTATWSITYDYQPSQIVSYNNHIYEFIGTQSLFTNGTNSVIYTPYVDIKTYGAYSNWLDITIWIEGDYLPIQTIKEFRLGSQTHSFNFTVDSNIDPYVTCEVTSDNGYGQIYTVKKNYEIRSIVGLEDTAPQVIYVPIETTTTSTTTTTTTIFTGPTGPNTLELSVNSCHTDGCTIYQVDNIPGAILWPLPISATAGYPIILNVPNGSYTVKILVSNCLDYFILNSSDTGSGSISTPTNPLIGVYLVHLNATGDDNFVVDLTCAVPTTTTTTSTTTTTTTAAPMCELPSGDATDVTVITTWEGINPYCLTNLGCDIGWVPIVVGGITISCQMLENEAPVVTSTGESLATSQLSSNYGIYGARIYKVGVTVPEMIPYTYPDNTTDAGTVVYSMTAATVWEQSGITPNGIANYTGIWTTGSHPIGQQTTIPYAFDNTGAPRTICVGVFGDNDFQLVVNNDIIINTGTTSTDIRFFRFFHIFQVDLISGLNIFNAVGTNEGSETSVGMAIFDNTAYELSTSLYIYDQTTGVDTNGNALPFGYTPTSPGVANMLWSSHSLIGTSDYSIQTCDSSNGWNLVTSGGSSSCVRLTNESPAQFNTGEKAFAGRARYLNGNPDGFTQSNINDANYVSPVVDLTSCPL